MNTKVSPLCTCSHCFSYSRINLAVTSSTAQNWTFNSCSILFRQGARQRAPWGKSVSIPSSLPPPALRFPLLCWSDVTSQGKFPSPGLIKGSRAILCQVERSRRNSIWVPWNSRQEDKQTWTQPRDSVKQACSMLTNALYTFAMFI